MGCALSTTSLGCSKKYRKTNMDFHYLGMISLISAISCVFIAEKRGGPALAWFILGALFGPLTILVALTAGKKCKACFSVIPKEAVKCRYCGEEI